MTTDEYNNEIDEGYPIRAFESELVASDWGADVSNDHPIDNKHFDDFLKTLNNAPSLTGLSEKADEDVHSLLESPYMNGCIKYLFDIASPIDNSPQKEAARKTLETLVDKGYPEVQLQYGQLLNNEGNVNKAHIMWTKVGSNVYASEAQSDYAILLKEQNPRKSLKQRLSESSGKSADKEPRPDIKTYPKAKLGKEGR